MFTNTIFGRASRGARFLVLAAALAVAAVPAAMSVGIDGAAYAQSSNGGGGGGGGGGGSGGNGPNPVLNCLGPNCINVNQARLPCTAGANYCKPEVKVIKFDGGCRIRACEVEDGRKTCHTNISYDERLCTKMKL